MLWQRLGSVLDDLHPLYLLSCRNVVFFLAMIESMVGSVSYMNKYGFTIKDNF